MKEGERRKEREREREKKGGRKKGKGERKYLPSQGFENSERRLKRTPRMRYR